MRNHDYSAGFLAKTYTDFTPLLKEELITAFGCTEPASIAYCSSKMREVLGYEPESITAECSGNVIKNVKSVVIPNSGNLVGIEAAALLGALGGEPDKGLEILSSINQRHIDRARELLDREACRVRLLETNEKLHIRISGRAGEHQASAEIKYEHMNIVHISYDGISLFEDKTRHESSFDGLHDDSFDGFREVEIETDSGSGFHGSPADGSEISISGIIAFAENVSLQGSELGKLLEKQIVFNSAIAEEGLKTPCGAEIGRLLLDEYGDSVNIRARAYAAAGSDARMSGCSKPVIINSGSGNQGITVTLPVVKYAEELGVTRDTLKRALIISNLTAIAVKSRKIRLSAFCGVVTAAAGSGAAVTWMHGGRNEQVSMTVINTLANISGIVCDGAKPSCASKIASAVDAALLAHQMSMRNMRFSPGEGIVQDDAERTMRNVRRLAGEGMNETDKVVLEMLLQY